MKKPDNKVGICRHIRLRRATDQALAEEAQKMGVAVATYIRIFIEKAFAEKGAFRYGK